MSSTNNDPLIISEKSISKAWAQVFSHIIDNPGNSVSPLLLNITNLGNHDFNEDNTGIQIELDKILNKKKFRNIENVAHTIFPERLWKLSKGDREKFYNLYTRTFLHYKLINPRENNRGSYFERLIAFSEKSPICGNQLEWIIREYNNRNSVRRSMLQASIFDPERDHVPNAQLQFPCMQHLTFFPNDNTLNVSAFYATQQIFNKGYGNYLGIARLGKFMASEMGLTLNNLSLFIGIAKIDKINKEDPDLEPLLERVTQVLSKPYQKQLTLYNT